ncbi:fucolectin-like [Dendropsophus ebraccatus]|uniref:fucolectin-like n=1 Tax=Dendropsophus ebraccatus TaxID=150705 RepID=UPI003831AFF5
METVQAVLIFLMLGGLKYETHVESAAVNVALQGLALQSSTVSGQGGAHLAIDGNMNTNFLKGSCSQTSSEYQPWWIVDLRRGYLIDTISITSQFTTMTSQAPWAEVNVGESLENYGMSTPRHIVIGNIAPGMTITLPLGGIFGRYVIIFIPNRNDTLTLCEVQVTALNVPDRKVGLMIKGVASSGSTSLPSREAMLQALKDNMKTNIQILSRGADNVLQRGG